MFEFKTKLSVIEEGQLRIAAAALVSVAAIGAFITRDNDVVSWIFLAPTVGVFWLWALANLSTRALPFFGLVTPLVLNLIENGAEVSMFLSLIHI